jgi:hypothetical protein
MSWDEYNIIEYQITSGVGRKVSRSDDAIDGGT